MVVVRASEELNAYEVHYRRAIGRRCGTISRLERGRRGSGPARAPGDATVEVRRAPCCVRPRTRDREMCGASRLGRCEQVLPHARGAIGVSVRVMKLSSRGLDVRTGILTESDFGNRRNAEKDLRQRREKNSGSPECGREHP